MTQQTYGLIAAGRVIEGVTITSFADWEDFAAKDAAEERSGKTISDVMPFHRARFQKRLAEDGANEIRLFPVGA